MKKLMKKKVSFFGKEFSVFALAVVMMVGLASAALVPYLSTALTGIATVDSPFSVGIAKGHVTSGFSSSVDLSPVYGGDESEATVQFKYLGSEANVVVKELFTISSTNITCGDFDAITFDSGNGPANILDSVTYGDWCTTGTDMITITDPSGQNNYDAGEINTVEITLDFKLNAKGTYTMAGRVIPVGETVITP